MKQMKRGGWLGQRRDKGAPAAEPLEPLAPDLLDARIGAVLRARTETGATPASWRRALRERPATE
ncbi:hypothetical protein BH18CHL2_BH18CHL2_07290 [soil metagenome]